MSARVLMRIKNLEILVVLNQKKLSNKQLKMIYAKIHIIALKYDGVISKEEIKNKLKVKLKIQSLSDLTRKQANQAIKVLIGWEI
ncbi:hypothetical protein [Bacillus thuringiensis]|uniref:hypothetical protein n=1 Tax=Bacillus thuringiensis TaxID=1428 RepID=UPI00211DEF56|nr:hypothetical protein [Bacillus thuringiensis]